MLNIPKRRGNSVEHLGFLGTVEENTRHFEVLLLFLSHRYGANLGRSGLLISILYADVVSSIHEV